MSLARREYPSYELYVYHQGGKARGKRQHLLDHLAKNTQGFERTFRAAAKYLKSGSVLCLGARTGAESIGATQAGFPGSVGIDLHPVGPTVLEGDWHDLKFANASFANCYSNSLDHCAYLDKLAANVQRVLMPGGRFYVMATNRVDNTEADWRRKPNNEVLHWDASKDLIDALCGYGFARVKEWHEGKWGHHVLKVVNA